MTPAVQSLVDRIAAGTVTPRNARAAIENAGGADFVALAAIRELAAGGGGGSGDVVGPASAVTDRIATFNGTTGKLVKDGGKTIAVVLSDAATEAGADATTKANAAQAAAEATAASDATTKANAAQSAAATDATTKANAAQAAAEATAAADATTKANAARAPLLYNLAYAASLTPDASAYGNRSIIRVTGWNGALTLNPPSNPVDGQVLEFWLTASGADRALTFAAGLIFPDEYTPTNPVTVTSGTKRKVGMQYDATLGRWEIDKNLGDYL